MPDVEIHYGNLSDKVWNVNKAKGTEQILCVSEEKWAACKYFTDEAFIDISVNSEKPKKVSLYFSEIYGIERIFEVSIVDKSGENLPKTIDLKEDGIYFSYEITGKIRLKLHNKTDSQAVISAIFID